MYQYWLIYMQTTIRITIENSGTGCQKKEMRERESERASERLLLYQLFCKLDLHYEKMHCIYFFPGRNVSSTDKKAS